MNVCNFLGKVTDGPHLSASDNGTPVVNFELELEEFRRGSGGEKHRILTYVSLEAWDTAAITIDKHAEIGTLLSVEASVRSEDMEDFVYNYYRVNKFKILCNV